eukprot:7070037-Alexandrium_andersonii.AAC.1
MHRPFSHSQSALSTEHRATFHTSQAIALELFPPIQKVLASASDSDLAAKVGAVNQMLSAVTGDSVEKLSMAASLAQGSYGIVVASPGDLVYTPPSFHTTAGAPANAFTSTIKQNWLPHPLSAANANLKKLEE